MNYQPELEAIFKLKSDQQILIQVVNFLRPAKSRQWSFAADRIDVLVSFLQAHSTAQMRLTTALHSVIEQSDLQYIFCESGLLTGSGFFSELLQKLGNKWFPNLPPNQDMRTVLRKIFRQKNDYMWVEALPSSYWIRLVHGLNLNLKYESKSNRQQMLDAGEKLSYRIAALGLDDKLMRQASHLLQPTNAFVEQNKTWLRYRQLAENNLLIHNASHTYSLMLQRIDAGLNNIKQIRAAVPEKGTSLQQSFLLERLHQHLERLQTIVTIIEPAVDVGATEYTEYFKKIVANENQHNRIRPFLSRNMSYLAYQIAEHGSKTGEKYITTNKKEYRQFFKSAAVGGVIISFAACIKIGLTNLHLPYFWASFTYGLNYALAFLVIQFLHGTIATKQPALTASTIALGLDNVNPKRPQLQRLAELNARVVRSQTASLIGNLIVVLPLTIAIAAAYNAFSGHQIIGANEIPKMLTDVSFSAKNVWFAALAGVLLFGSGIISGYFDNLVVYANIPGRLRNHKGLAKLISAKRRVKLSHYVEHNLGAIMGNVLLGFGLGFLIFFGKIFGLPLDIRHVTISTGFFGFSMFSSGFQLSAAQVFWSAVGLFSIALTNLVVSFTLALFTALKSRGVSSRQLLPLAKLTAQHFLRFPTHFFYPPRQEGNSTQDAVDLRTTS
ncbi:MAG: hypothetical protein EAY75_09090 [Bacteroidetes bacterium]|nr:MAG: hypothetical protein EAY75_09090 [Bacteroidota bacterium]